MFTGLKYWGGHGGVPKARKERCKSREFFRPIAGIVDLAGGSVFRAVPDLQLKQLGFTLLT